MLEGFADEGSVAVDFASEGQDGDFAVGESEVVCENRTGHHAGDLDVGVWDLFEFQAVTDFGGEGAGVVAEEDYWGW